MKAQIVTERGDALIATAARASFNRRSDQYTDEQNEGLQRYLVRPTPQHFAPFCHVRLTLRLDHWMIIYKKLDAYNKTGMIEVRQSDGVVDVSHSLYGWYILLRDKKVHFSIADSVIDHLQAIAPVAAKVLDLDKYRARDMHKDGYVQVHQAPLSYETDFVTLRVELPIAIARQIMKSVVGYMYSEASGRYIVYSKIHMPTELHGKPDNKKQGSGKPLGFIRNAIARAVIKASYAVSKLAYNFLHRVIGVAVEESRCVMPLYTGTVFVVTAARQDWDRLLQLRTAGDAQTDIQVLAGLIAEELEK
ncbi:MAG TPA: FAD-dependent thymidylate synthase [Candidatus Saccharibacteria bacterium]|nr:FAD-dependent thymidylate synthase [Candidatus Saccharibacteria bacterium]